LQPSPTGWVGRRHLPCAPRGGDNRPGGAHLSRPGCSWGSAETGKLVVARRRRWATERGIARAAAAARDVLSLSLGQQGESLAVEAQPFRHLFLLHGTLLSGKIQAIIVRIIGVVPRAAKRSRGRRAASQGWRSRRFRC